MAAMASKFKTVSSELTLEEAFSPENIRSRLKKPEDIFRFEYCTMNEKQFKSIAISPLAWTEGENRQAAAIRSLHKQDGKTIPIVAMTANAFAEDILLAKNAGMNEHISKPLDMTRLRDVLRRWLERRIFSKRKSEVRQNVMARIHLN